MTYRTLITPQQMRKGDIISAHGGTFRIEEDGYSSMYREDVFIAPATCISGYSQGYFGPGSHWAFQGNDMMRYTKIGA